LAHVLPADGTFLPKHVGVVSLLLICIWCTECTIILKSFRDYGRWLIMFILKAGCKHVYVCTLPMSMVIRPI